MASASVSRSGRVRKKSAKLMEMETEVTPNQNNSDLNRSTKKLSVSVSHNSSGVDNNSSAEELVDKTDSDSGPPKKKLKLRLCLNPSPSITPEDKSALNESSNESLPKKTTIPVLKIPKSKITGLVPNITTNDQNSEKISTKIHSESGDNKTKNIKKQLIIESKSEEFVSTESPSVETTAAEESVIKIESKSSVKLLPEKAITETPKVSKEVKPKKREQESAANKLFRQITSGVGVTPKTKGNKKNKSLPLEDTNTQITFDEEFSETALIIEETDSVTKIKPKNKRSRPSKTSKDNNKEETKRTKRRQKDGDDKPKKKRTAVITAYMIWSKEHRSKIQQTCPDLDFADVSRKLGEIWQSMPEKDKIPWRRKAQKLIATGSSLISTGKQPRKPVKPGAPINTKPLNSSTAPVSPPPFNDDYDSNYDSIEDLWQPVGIDPMDVSAHLTLLGESLSIIGQRLKEHSGQIAVSGSLSVLLDSTLCAIGPLLCLTKLHPSLNGCSEETHKKTLDNIAYIMPGI